MQPTIMEISDEEFEQIISKHINCHYRLRGASLDYKQIPYRSPHKRSCPNSRV